MLMDQGRLKIASVVARPPKPVYELLPMNIALHLHLPFYSPTFRRKAVWDDPDFLCSSFIMVKPFYDMNVVRNEVRPSLNILALLVMVATFRRIAVWEDSPGLSCLCFPLLDPVPSHYVRYGPFVGSPSGIFPFSFFCLCFRTMYTDRGRPAFRGVGRSSSPKLSVLTTGSMSTTPQFY